MGGIYPPPLVVLHSTLSGSPMSELGVFGGDNSWGYKHHTCGVALRLLRPSGLSYWPARLQSHAGLSIQALAI